MDIKYDSYYIDINYISCLFSELKDALSKLKENYSCSDRITIRITDKNKEIYIYYKSFSGIRIISTIKCYTVFDVDDLIPKSKIFHKGFVVNEMYKYILKIL